LFLNSYNKIFLIVSGNPTFVSKLIYISISNNLNQHLLNKTSHEPVLIVSATKLEVQPLMKAASRIMESDEGLFTLTFDKNTLNLLITGVGIPASTFGIASFLAQNPIRLAIHIGIAGSYSPEIRNGQAVMVVEDEFGDIGIDQNYNFGTVFEAGFTKLNHPPFSSGRLVSKPPANILLTEKLKKVKGLTVNMVTSNKTINQNRIDKFQAEIETMESAAFFYCCLKNELPFISLRGISNRVGESDRSKWLIKEAIQSVCSTLVKILHKNNYFNNET
jgi:futalosine hydrolase